MMERTFRIIIPADVAFADLELGRLEDGQVTFRWEPVEKVCQASGIDVAVFKKGHEDNVSGLLVTWYAAHVDAGGPPDVVAEQLIQEVLDEDRQVHERRN